MKHDKRFKTSTFAATGKPGHIRESNPKFSQKVFEVLVFFTKSVDGTNYEQTPMIFNLDNPSLTKNKNYKQTCLAVTFQILLLRSLKPISKSDTDTEWY